MKSSFSQGIFSFFETRFRVACSVALRRGWLPVSRVCAFVALILGIGPVPRAAAEGLSVAESGLRPNQWTITYDGKTVMVYAFDAQQFKPYVKALNSIFIIMPSSMALQSMA